MTIDSRCISAVSAPRGQIALILTFSHALDPQMT